MDKNPLVPEALSRRNAPELFEGFAAPHRRDEISFGDVSRVIRRQRKVILRGCLLGLVLGLLISLVMKPEYESLARVELKPGDGNKLGLSDFSPDAGAAADDLGTNLTTAVQMLQSTSLALETVQQMGLEKDDAYFPKKRRFLAEANLPLAQAPERRTYAVDRFERKLTIEPVPGTRLVQIKFKDQDAKRSSEVVNALISNYNSDYIRRYYLGSVQASEWLQKQISDLKQQVTSSENRLTEYGKQNGFFGFVGTGTDPTDNPMLQKLVTLNQSVVQAEAERIQKEATARLLATRDPEVIIGLGANPQIANGVGGTDLALLQSLRLREAEEGAQYAQMQARYGAKYPALVETRSELDSLHLSISRVVEKLRSRAVNDLAIASKNEEMLQQSFNKQAAEANEMNDKATQYKLLSKEAEGSRALYEALLTKLREAQVAASVRGSNIVLLDPAMVTPRPSTPNYPLNMAIGLGAGLILSLGLGFYRARNDQGIERLDVFEALSPVPVLGAVPTLKPVTRLSLSTAFARSLKGRGVRGRVGKADQVAVAAEAYNQIRAAIVLRARDAVPQALLVTSPLSGDGKSTTVAGLAMTFATGGSKVLVLDADLRNRQAGDKDLRSGTKGFWDLLKVGGDPDSYIQSHGTVENLFFLPAGQVSDHPLALLESPRFQAALQELKSRFDFVIIDSPPTSFFADVSVMTPHVDAAVLVVRAGVTSQQAFDRACSTLSHARGRIIGVVVNDLAPNSASFYGYYGYSGKDLARSYADSSM